MYPEDFRYTKEHEWVKPEGDTALVGITDHAQKELGDIVYVDLPKVGAQVEKGKSLGEEVAAQPRVILAEGVVELFLNGAVARNGHRLGFHRSL